MAGTLVVGEGESFTGTMEIPRSDTTQYRNPRDVVIYHSGTPAGTGSAGTAGYVSTTTATELVTFDVTGVRAMNITIDNRSDEDIDGGGANNKDVDITLQASITPTFATGAVTILSSTTTGEGAATVIHLGEGVRGGDATLGDLDGDSKVTLATEGFPWRYLRVLLDAETEDAESYFEVFAYGVPY